MASTFSVGLEFSAKTQQLDAAMARLTRLERDLGKLKGADPFQGVENSARGAGEAVDGMGKKAKAATGAVSGLGSALRSLAIGAAALQAGKFIFGKTAELESQTASLKVLTGELGKAKSIIGELQQFANVTPFTSTELIETAKRLKAFGVNTEKLVDTTKRLGDVAGATGADLSGIATAYGQIQAKGRLQGEELLQLQERGINLQEELQKMYKMSGDEFRSSLEKGRFSAAAVELALKNLTSAGGKYANGAISQSETLNGKLSTLQDAFDELGRVIGKALSPAVIQVLTEAASQTAKWTGVVNNLGDAWFYASEQIKPFINGLGQIKWYFENLTPPGWAMKLTGWMGQEIPGAVGGMAERGRELKGYGGTSRFAGARDAAFERARGITGATAPAAGPPPALLGGTGGGAGSRSAATKLAGPKLPEYISKEVLRKWLISQGMGRTSGDFTNSGHRTPNHMLNAMDMGFTSSKYDHNYVQKTIEMERKLRATGAFGNQLFGPERDPRGHATHLHVPTPGGMVKMNPALANLMGMAGGGQEGQYELAQNLADAEAERLKNLQESLKAGQELSQQFSRELQIRQAATPLEKEILQIKHEHADRQVKISELQDETQKKALEQLNTDLERLRVLEAQVKAFYDQADAAGALSAQMKAQGSGAFRTDIDLDPNKKTGKIQSYMDQLKTDLADTEGMITSLAGTIESEIGSAMSNAITGLIQGTMTAQQAFSQMFSAIGKAFIDMATQMIAKALVMKVLGILGGGGGGGLFSGGGPVAMPGAGVGGGGSMFMPGAPSFFATGGFVTGPTRAVIGEGGESEYVIPSSKMGAAMSNYRAGRRGAGVLEGGGETGSGSGGGGTFTLETVVINSVEYATVAQVQEMGAAATRRGAEGGHAKSMGALRNNRSTRARLGMNR